eukprot:g21493.t1
MYRSIRCDQVLELLNLPEKDLDARVKKMGWTKCKEAGRCGSFRCLGVEGELRMRIPRARISLMCFLCLKLVLEGAAGGIFF